MLAKVIVVFLICLKGLVIYIQGILARDADRSLSQSVFYKGTSVSGMGGCRLSLLPLYGYIFTSFATVSEKRCVRLAGL